MNDVAIIGGGAAGLVAALRCSQLLSRRGMAPVSVAVFEAAAKVGRPILRSGNGRCNFSHLPLDPNDYEGGPFVAEVLDRLEELAPADVQNPCETMAVEQGAGSNAVLRFFEDLGLVWRAEPDGRLYPLANRASVVLDGFLRALRALNVTMTVEAPVRAIVAPTRPGKPFTLEMEDGSFERARRVIVACGGEISERLVPQTVAVTPTRPVLGPLRLHANPFKVTDGQRIRCALELRRDGESVASEVGEVLFRPYGFSGIVTFDLSRWAQPGDELVADFLPDESGREIDDERAVEETAGWLEARSRQLGAETPGDAGTYGTVMCGLFSRAMGEALCRIAAIDEDGITTPEGLRQLARVIRRCRLRVDGMGPAGNCQVHRGGVARDALNPATLEIAAEPGLYVVGEAVNVDGPCGGYNLHWAWASALVAAHAVVDAMARERGEGAYDR